MKKPEASKIVVTLHHLATHGWVSLRSMSALLGYSHATGVYGRQRGKNAIPTVKIGSVHRVYADDVVHELNNRPEKDQEAAGVLLRIYYAALKEKGK